MYVESTNNYFDIYIFSYFTMVFERIWNKYIGYFKILMNTMYFDKISVVVVGWVTFSLIQNHFYTKY